jgi:hypothetical protein
MSACQRSSKVFIEAGTYNTQTTANILQGNLTIELDSGVIWNYTGTAEAFKIGNDTTTVVECVLIGNMATITHGTLGGTYGIHVENGHLCRVENFRITYFATAEVFLEGSWSTWVKNVEVPYGPGQYGLLLRKTQAGAFTANLNDLSRIHECWFQGTAAAIYNRENSEDIEIEGCDVHDSPIGILDDGSRNIKYRNNYFENNSTYCIYLRGTDALVVAADIEGNFFGTNQNNYPVIFVANANIVSISKNDLNPPSSGSTFVSTPSAGARCISLDRNRLGVPAWVTEYGGDAGSLIYQRTMYDAYGNAVYNKHLPFSNNLFLSWVDNAGTPRNCLGLAPTNILILKNYAVGADGFSDIQISPEVAGGYILFFDDGATYQMAKWTKDWAQPVCMRGADPTGLGSGDLAKMWYNTSMQSYRYWDGSMYRTLFTNPANGSFLPGADATYDLGQTSPSSLQWRSLYLSADAHVVGEIYIGQDIRRVTAGYDLYLGSSVTSGKGVIVWNWVDGNYGPLSASYIQCYNNLWIQGNITSVNAIACNMLPSADNTYSLGNAGLKWAVIYGVTINASSTLYAGSNVNTDGVYQKGGVQVVGARQSDPGNISDTSGTANDGTCRAKLNSIMQCLRNHGLIG